MGVEIFRLQLLVRETHRTSNSDSVQVTNIGHLQLVKQNTILLNDVK